MKQYQILGENPTSSVELVGGGPNIPRQQTNGDWRIILAEIAAGEAELLPYVAPELHWKDKRRAKLADGGYGSILEQLEMIGEGGASTIASYQTHIAAVKAAHPKE